MTKDTAIFILCLFALLEAAPAQTSETAPPIETIIERMAQARIDNHASFRPYTITRDYKLFGKDLQQPKSEVLAEVSFVPPDRKNFEIRQARGTGMGESVVRRMLKSEVEIAGDDNTDISAQNYSFRYLSREILKGRLCYVLELQPRRTDKHLMTGKAWVDAETYLLHRAEGAPARKPSWWVRDLHFTLSYGDVSGMWLPTAVEATAQIRLIGPCKLISQNVGISIGEFAASRSPELSMKKRRYRGDQ